MQEPGINMYNFLLGFRMLYSVPVGQSMLVRVPIISYNIYQYICCLWTCIHDEYQYYVILIFNNIYILYLFIYL